MKIGVLGFRGSGFRGLGFRGLGVQGLGFRAFLERGGGGAGRQETLGIYRDSKGNVRGPF